MEQVNLIRMAMQHQTSSGLDPQHPHPSSSHTRSNSLSFFKRFHTHTPPSGSPLDFSRLIFRCIRIGDFRRSPQTSSMGHGSFDIFRIPDSVAAREQPFLNLAPPTTLFIAWTRAAVKTCQKPHFCALFLYRLTLSTFTSVE